MALQDQGFSIAALITTMTFYPKTSAPPICHPSQTRSRTSSLIPSLFPFTDAPIIDHAISRTQMVVENFAYEERCKHQANPAALVSWESANGQVVSSRFAFSFKTISKYNQPLFIGKPVSPNLAISLQTFLIAGQGDRYHQCRLRGGEAGYREREE